MPSRTRCISSELASSGICRRLAQTLAAPAITNNRDRPSAPSPATWRPRAISHALVTTSRATIRFLYVGLSDHMDELFELPLRVDVGGC
jgi:hypothetical protein